MSPPPQSPAPSGIDSDALRRLVETVMPFGRYASRPISDLPEDYLLWFRQQGFPKGDLGGLMALALEIKVNGLEYLLEPLRRGRKR